MLKCCFSPWEAALRSKKHPMAALLLNDSASCVRKQIRSTGWGGGGVGIIFANLMHTHDSYVSTPGYDGWNWSVCVCVCECVKFAFEPLRQTIHGTFLLFRRIFPIPDAELSGGKEGCVGGVGVGVLGESCNSAQSVILISSSSSHTWAKSSRNPRTWTFNGKFLQTSGQTFYTLPAGLKLYLALIRMRRAQNESGANVRGLDVPQRHQ